MLGSKIKLDVDEKADLAFKGSFGITTTGTNGEAFTGLALGLKNAGEYTSDNLVAGLKIMGESAKIEIGRAHV